MPTWTSPYQPYLAQQRAHASKAGKQLFLGGIGAGKTLFGVHETAWLAQDNPKSDGMIVAPTYPMLRDVIMPLWQDYIHHSLYTWKKGVNQIHWHPTGRTIFLRTATHPDRLRGPNVGYAWMDEPAMLISKKPWELTSGRVRCPKAQRRRIIATTTPRGYNWLIKAFQRGGEDYHVVRARTKDNPYLPDDFEAGLRALYGDEFAAQELDARILAMHGIAWPVLGRVHMRLSLQAMLDRCVMFFGGVDWGFTNPAALVVGGIDIDGRWYFVETWYKRGQERERIADAALDLTKKYNIKCWYADHDPEGVAAMGKKRMSVILADKDVVSGVQFVRSLFPVRNDGQPRAYVNPGSEMKDWHREQEGYQFPSQDEDKKPSDKDEVPIVVNGDHAMDATRYMTYTQSKTWVMPAYTPVEKSRYQEESRDWGAY